LAMERPLLFLDEPFSALDVLTADTLRDEIMKIFLSKKTKTRSMLVVTHNIQEAVLMADRVLVLGTNPGHIRAEFENNLPYPRIPDSAPFLDLVSKIHGVITETYMPDTAPHIVNAVHWGLKLPAVEILPDVHITDIVGLIEAVSGEGGAVDIFALASGIENDFGRTLYLVKAAELLSLAETPKQQVVLTKNGISLVSMDINGRKKLLNENFAKLLIVQKITELLRRSSTLRIPVADLKEKVIVWLPHQDPDKIVETLISWGRYAEYFGYNDNTKSIYLDVGQEIR